MQRRTSCAHRREISKLFNEPAPCDDCPSARRCGLFQIACHDFEVYVSSGLVVQVDREASPDILDRIFDYDEED